MQGLTTNMGGIQGCPPVLEGFTERGEHRRGRECPRAANLPNQALLPTVQRGSITEGEAEHSLLLQS